MHFFLFLNKSEISFWMTRSTSCWYELACYAGKTLTSPPSVTRTAFLLAEVKSLSGRDYLYLSVLYYHMDCCDCLELAMCVILLQCTLQSGVSLNLSLYTTLTVGLGYNRSWWTASFTPHYWFIYVLWWWWSPAPSYQGYFYWKSDRFKQQKIRFCLAHTL